MLRRVNGAGKAIAATTLADNFHAPGRHLVTERCGGLKVDWVPGQLYESVAALVRIRTGHVRTPVAPRVILRAPHAGFFGGHARWVDVKAVDNQRS